MKYVIINLETNKYLNNIKFTGMEEGEEEANIEWVKDILLAKLMNSDLAKVNFKCIKDYFPNLKIEIREL